MDKNTVIGLLLIFIITMAWAFYTMPGDEELEQRRLEQAMQDSIAAAQADPESTSVSPETGITDSGEVSSGSSELSPDTTGGAPGRVLGVFGEASYPDTVHTTIRTPLYEIELTNLGAGPSKYTLSEYNTWNQQPVQMIHDTLRSAYSLGFLSQQNYNIETNELVFEPLFDEELIEISENDSTQISYRLNLNGSSGILFTYTFHAEYYAFDLDIEFLNGAENQISGTSVDFGWKTALNLTEQDLVQDAQNTAAYVFAGGELEKFQLTEQNSGEQTINGNIEWISTRTRFFGQYIKPLTDANAAYLTGELTGDPESPSTIHHYQSSVQSGISGNSVLSYELYAGPLLYNELKQFDEHAYDVIEIGYAIFRWFADPLVRYLIIPFFSLGSSIIPNYGILIILFGVIVKLLLFPLTQKSFKSMAAMKELQPQMKEIQEKYKDDPQKQQKETIALYRKAKVNPLGGCLPMLLQFPILITLFFFFQNSMLIRQESFLWANDLSAPDYILSLPLSIPFMGDQIAGFVLLMTAAMFVQTKISGGMSGGAAPSGGPNMKAFQYMMPVMLLFVFNNFAAGLSLYYLVYNVLSVAQQAIINKQVSGNKPDEEETKGQKRKKRKTKTKK